MCLAIPGKVIELKGETCSADFNGEILEVSTKMIQPKNGDYIIAAAGIVTDVVPEWRAKEMLEIFQCK